MTLNAYPVRLQDGEVRTLDGSPLPERAYAVLVILPEPASGLPPEAWREPFDAYLAALQAHPAPSVLDDLSDSDLNHLVHQARRVR